MPESSDPVVAIGAKALPLLLDVRSREPDADELGLVISVSGVSGDGYTYEMAFMRLDDAGPEDHVDTSQSLPLIIPAADVATLSGASLQMSRNLLEPGLTIENPNSPSPAISAEHITAPLTGSVAERVVAIVDQAINPAIASHGGVVEVVAVEDGTAYVRMGGGSQGCGMASVTLTQGIESTITQAVSEISKVVDVTDHAGGTNPYYEQAKK
jgi:Fe/S biogenesis protein NfuA